MRGQAVKILLSVKKTCHLQPLPNWYKLNDGKWLISVLLDTLLNTREGGAWMTDSQQEIVQTQLELIGKTNRGTISGRKVSLHKECREMVIDSHSFSGYNEISAIPFYETR